jgi:hypothetical protein
VTTLSWSRSSPTSPAALCLTLPSGVCRERRVPDHAGLPGRRRGGAERPGGGGRAVLLHSKTAEGAPADFFGSHGSIRPFAGSPWTALTSARRTGT